MRRPNYKVFVYHHTGNFICTVKVWAVNAQKAMDKARKQMNKEGKDEMYYTFVPQQVNQPCF